MQEIALGVDTMEEKMASKNLKRTELEKKQHEIAVKVRKMTDEKLCNYLESLTLKEDKPLKDDKTIINDFLTYVYNQPSNGIGKAIMTKLTAELDNYIIM